MQSLYPVPSVCNFTVSNQRIFFKVTHNNKSPILTVIKAYIYNAAKYICVHFFLALADNLINFLLIYISFSFCNIQFYEFMVIA